MHILRSSDVAAPCRRVTLESLNTHSASAGTAPLVALHSRTQSI